jgi:tetratricopeptide (TPR) repeat protein
MPTPDQSPQPLALYNPALLPPHVLLAEFTARRPLLNSLIEIIRHNPPAKPLQHALLVGARGMGKTTTLWAVAYTVQADPELSQQWLPVVFDEESRRVGDLADFWLEAVRQWEHAAKDPEDRTQRLLDNPGPDIEAAARNAFLEKVDRSGRRALLLVDNLNDVLASIHDPEPLHRLRAFLMEDSRVMVLGTATRYFDQVTDLDQPFYDFFRVFDLRPLTLEEMKASLLALAEARRKRSVSKTLEERSGTIQGLYLLTGGNPRLVKTFYRLLTGGLRGDIRADLERLLDEFTPYFKAVVDALPVQQQRIFDAVALAWDPVEVAAIARVTRLPSNQVSAQLRSLAKAGLVAEAAGHPKRKTYLLADRFSNIHYLMRHGRAARNRFDWFVALVRLVFPDTQAETLAKLARQSAECGPEGMRDARDLLHCALGRAESADSRRQVLYAAFREAWDREALRSLSEWLDLAEANRHLPETEIVAFFSRMPTDLRKELDYRPDDPSWWLRLADTLEEKEAGRLAEAACRKAVTLDPKSADGWSSLGWILMDKLSRFSEAEAAYRRALVLAPDHLLAHVNLGHLLGTYLNRTCEAEVHYRKAITMEPGDAALRVFLADLLADHTTRNAEAEAAYREAIILDPKDGYAWMRLGDILAERQARYREAETTYRKGIETHPEDMDLWLHLADLYADDLDQPTEAEAAYEKAIALAPGDPQPLVGLGRLLSFKTERFPEAELAFRKAILVDSQNAFAYAGLGLVLKCLHGPSREAEAALHKVTQLDPRSSFAWSILAYYLNSQDGRILETEAAYRKAVELDPKDGSSWLSLAGILARQQGRQLEARACAVKALVLDPVDGSCDELVLRLCGDHIEDWRAILPSLAGWCLANPTQARVFSFTVDGFIRYARLTTPHDALALLESLPDPRPFETLMDTFRTQADHEHLNRLAPERRAVVLELLKRLDGQGGAKAGEAAQRQAPEPQG